MLQPGFLAMWKLILCDWCNKYEDRINSNTHQANFKYVGIMVQYRSVLRTSQLKT